MRMVLRVGAIAALAVAGLLGMTDQASADATATIELHLRYCPPGAVDVFADCHDHPIEGLVVSLRDPESITTNAEGNALFTVEGGVDNFWFYSGLGLTPNDYVASYCSVDGGDGSDIESKEGDRAEWTFLIPVAPGDHVVCDIYFWNWEMDPIEGGAGVPNTGAGPAAGESTGGIYLAGALALAGLAVASRKRALR